MRGTVKFYLSLLLMGLLGFAACKGTGRGAPDAGATLTATVQATLITDATPPATHVWKQPTTIIKSDITPTATALATPAADSQMVERGKGIYEKNECGRCHGANGEGVAEKGARLARTLLTEAEFKDVLRTGGKGKLGNEHIFGTSAISESGITAVYAFLQSLGQ